MNDIFISHSHADSDFAEILHSKLIAAGFTVWRDTVMVPGADWRKEIDRAIQEASALIVMITSQAKASEYVTYEWAFALGAGVKIIPLLLEQTKLHPRLESLQYLDFTNRTVRPWDKLIELLRKQKESRIHGIPPAGPIHGYSGEWQVTTTFLRWQGRPVDENDRVVFDGTMFLLLAADGQNGSGTQTGELNVSIGNWEATYQVANQITKAHVTQDGGLHIFIQVLSRKRIKGPQPPPPYRDDLFGKGQFDVTLHQAQGNARVLEGGHNYLSGYPQEATETYKYIGFVAAASG
jgi:hypothetical protein